MAAWSDHNAREIEALAQERYERWSADRHTRLEATKRKLAEMGNGSPLFGALREGYMEADPEFRARMESMVGEGMVDIVHRAHAAQVEHDRRIPVQLTIKED